jgi:predicted urease superfamily metal-dependent hydrolase
MKFTANKAKEATANAIETRDINNCVEANEILEHKIEPAIKAAASRCLSETIIGTKDMTTAVLEIVIKTLRESDYIVSQDTNEMLIAW